MVFGDARGLLSVKPISYEDYKAAGIPAVILYRTTSPHPRRGVLRGLHFQIEQFPQDKA